MKEKMALLELFQISLTWYTYLFKIIPYKSVAYYSNMAFMWGEEFCKKDLIKKII